MNLKMEYNNNVNVSYYKTRTYNSATINMLIWSRYLAISGLFLLLLFELVFILKSFCVIINKLSLHNDNMYNIMWNE